MERQRFPLADSKPPRARKEWNPQGEHEHPLEARHRHARDDNRARRTLNVRADEADRQIRELRSRY